MGRSSREEAARTRARIVDAASEMFRISGLDQVTVAEIMAALGLTTGGFYKHFASKEALVAEAMQLAFAQSCAAWRTVSPAGLMPGEGRARLVQHYLRPDPQQRCPMIAFAPHSSKPEADEASRQVFRHGIEDLLKSFSCPAKDAGSEEPLPDMKPEAKVLFAAMIGVRLLKDAVGDVAWASDLRDAVLEAAAVEA